MSHGPLFALVDNYRKYRVAAGIGVRTAHDQRLILLHFAECFHRKSPDKAVAKLDQADVVRYLNEVRHQKPGTRRNKYSVVHGFCQWLLRRRYIKRDPFLELKAPRVPKSVPKVFDPAEIDLMHNVGCRDERERMVLLLGFGMGLRVGEMSALELGDIGIKSATVTGKGDKERYVPISRQVRVAINAYVAVRGTWAGPLIENLQRPGEGVTAHTLSWMIREIAIRAGVKGAPYDGKSAHGMRRTFATEIADQTEDIQGVSELLGHENIQTTKQFYARHNAAKLAPLVESLPWFGGPKRTSASQAG